jgi:hypothetical protein
MRFLLPIGIEKNSFFTLDTEHDMRHFIKSLKKGTPIEFLRLNWMYTPRGICFQLSRETKEYINDQMKAVSALTEADLHLASKIDDTYNLNDRLL